MASEEVNIPYAKMTGARQTMLSWARDLTSFELIPEVYKDSYLGLVGRVDALPHTVLAPAQSSGRGYKSAERLLVDGGDCIYILERTGAQVVITGYAYRDIACLETGKILLYSWFSIYGKTCAGPEQLYRVEFNEVTLRHFRPFLNRMRPAVPDTFGAAQKTENGLGALSQVNYKFMNFAYDSLVSGEKVIQYLYQPEIRQPLFSIFGHRFTRSVAYAHMAMLTDKELILIGDVEQLTGNQRSSYGGAWQHLPLRSLSVVTLTEQPQGLINLTLQFSADFQLSRLFEAAHFSELESLKKSIENLL
jgi:hypothetical protein